MGCSYTDFDWVRKNAMRKRMPKRVSIEARAKILRMETVLDIEDGEGRGIGEFFEDGRKHHGAEADGITGDNEENELKGEGDGGESVVEGGVGDRRRVFLTDDFEQEEQGREDEDAPDKGDVEDDAGEGHGVTSAAKAASHIRRVYRSAEIAASPKNSNGVEAPDHCRRSTRR
jgi:hypothetical protein